MTDMDRNIAEGYERLRSFVITATKSAAEPCGDWRAAINDAALDLDEIVTSSLAHPDDVARARLAMGSLAHIWLTVEEAEALYLGDRKIGTTDVP